MGIALRLNPTSADRVEIPQILSTGRAPERATIPSWQHLSITDYLLLGCLPTVSAKNTKLSDRMLVS